MAARYIDPGGTAGPGAPIVRLLASDALWVRFAAPPGELGRLTVGTIVDHIDHVVKHAGIDHVGLGSDFDGSVRAPFDTSGDALVTDALIAEGFSDAEIERLRDQGRVEG